MKDKRKELETELKRLDASAKKLIETRGYTKEVDKLRMLEELIREQLANENFICSTRTAR